MSSAEFTSTVSSKTITGSVIEENHSISSILHDVRHDIRVLAGRLQCSKRPVKQTNLNLLQPIVQVRSADLLEAQMFYQPAALNLIDKCLIGSSSVTSVPRTLRHSLFLSFKGTRSSPWCGRARMTSLLILAMTAV